MGKLVISIFNYMICVRKGALSFMFYTFIKLLITIHM